MDFKLFCFQAIVEDELTGMIISSIVEDDLDGFLI